MDPFSHLLLGYLLGFGLWGASGLQYVIAAAIAGALPDADVALYPLSKRFPLLRHRGASHSILGVTVIAAVGMLVVPYAMGQLLGPFFAAGPLWKFFVSLEVGGLSHVLLDSMDHWSVPIFAPFSEREYRFDADRIVNVGSMAFTVIAYGLLLEERGRAPVWLWSLTSWLLLALAVGYIALRLLVRWRAGVAASTGIPAGHTSGEPVQIPLRRRGARGRWKAAAGGHVPTLARDYRQPPGRRARNGSGAVEPGSDRARGNLPELCTLPQSELDARRDPPFRRGTSDP